MHRIPHADTGFLEEESCSPQPTFVNNIVEVFRRCLIAARNGTHVTQLNQFDYRCKSFLGLLDDNWAP